MVADFVAGLRNPISVDRLESYRFPGESDTQMLVNYVWNVQLCESLYPALQALEISTRNAIHAASSAHFGNEFWFDLEEVLLSRQAQMIQEARRKVRESGRPLTAGRIVAAAPFGFWTSLLNRPYEMPHPNMPAKRLYWHSANNQPTLLLDAFPNLPRSFRSRGAVWQRLDHARELRNRVFHHEPIWNRPGLTQDHREILEAIAWISSEMSTLTLLSDRFEQVRKNGRSEIESAIRAQSQRG